MNLVDYENLKYENYYLIWHKSSKRSSNRSSIRIGLLKYTNIKTLIKSISLEGTIYGFDIYAGKLSNRSITADNWFDSIYISDEYFIFELNTDEINNHIILENI